ncbi:MAG: carbamoyl phosphate synthase small subunit, partial [Alphaproteobacteria bacterium]|nr:carbamoyl phosphate synthase small subunit [Alphaproteobacteria bacterium]
HLDGWLRERGRIGLAGVDTRALTRLIRKAGAPNAVIAHSASGIFDIPALAALAAAWPGLEGMDLAKVVTTRASYAWDGGLWARAESYAEAQSDKSDITYRGEVPSKSGARVPHVVAIDYGIKHNILRNLIGVKCQVTVVPATASFDEIMALNPQGLFLSNGPGDPAATGVYAVPVIQAWLKTGKPLFGICLGHQMLALALGARTVKMHQGHRGANHPVKRLSDGAVEITSMNHGFAVDRDTLPANVRETHVSLFDGSNCGIELAGAPVFSVQYHPEASPGPMDSHYLFEKFAGMMS